MLTDQQVIELVRRTDPVPNVEHLPGPRHDALTLLAKADPHVPPRPKACGELLIIERSRNMDTQQRPEVQDTTPRSGWRTAAISFAAIILVVGAVAGIAALIVNDSDETGSELPEEAAQLLDDYRDAWMNQDVEAFYASITDDFFSRSYFYGTNTHTLWKDWVDDAGTASGAARMLEFDDPMELIEVRGVVVSGDGPWIVTANEIWEQEKGIRYRWDGNYTRVIVEDAGTMKIASVIAAQTITEAEN